MNRDFEVSAFTIIPDALMPIFQGRKDDLTLFYAPGYLAAAQEKAAQEIEGILSGELPFGNRTAAYLIEAARTAWGAWFRVHDPKNYKPTCLTIYTTLGCNLNCTYCFAKKERNDSLLLDTDHILDSARGVIHNCREKKEPFTVVFHGGGEPSLDPRLREIFYLLREQSERSDVPFRSYIATNGVMNAEQARWIAENFDEVGLSVDGPAEIQNTQRPLRSGGDSAEIVERTAAIFREIKSHLTLRVTVLPEKFTRIPEIAVWGAEMLHADEIHFEPVYHSDDRASRASADDFCSALLQARQELPETAITYSGSRIREIHGRYCQLFRQVLQLVPPKSVSPCFALSSEEAVNQMLPEFFAGTVSAWEPMTRDDPACQDCFNFFHCARGCPDVCPAMSDETRDAGSFRCRVNRRLAEAELLEIAESRLAEYARQYGYAGMKLREY